VMAATRPSKSYVLTKVTPSCSFTCGQGCGVDGIVMGAPGGRSPAVGSMGVD
jgi:hypothetical protein